MDASDKGGVVEVTSATFESFVRREGIALLDWWAPWCGPCRAFAPVFARAAERHPDVAFGKVNTDQEGELASAFGIRSIPSLMVVRDGIILFFQPGALPESALDGLLQRARELDMDEVRRQVAEEARKGAPAAPVG